MALNLGIFLQLPNHTWQLKNNQLKGPKTMLTDKNRKITTEEKNLEAVVENDEYKKQYVD